MNTSPKTNSEDAVYEKLKTAIRKRYIKQGSQLVEVNLAKQLGMSRTPVRSAIKRLVAEGLVNAIPNRGGFVISPSKCEIRETFQVRAQLEVMATRLTIERITDAQIADLEKMLSKETQVLCASDLEQYYEVNDDLHLRIARLSGNNVLLTYIRELLEKTRIYLILYDPLSQIQYAPIEEHAAIISAIAARDVERACDAVEAHINNAINQLESVEALPDDYIAL